MTRQHFIAIAEIVSEINDEEDRDRTANLLADYFRSQNAQFKRDTFISACLPTPTRSTS